MSSVWLVWCRHCRKATTIGPPPGATKFSSRIACSLCDRDIDATKGKWRELNKMRGLNQPKSLLEVR